GRRQLPRRPPRQGRAWLPPQPQRLPGGRFVAPQDSLTASLPPGSADSTRGSIRITQGVQRQAPALLEPLVGGRIKPRVESAEPGAGAGRDSLSAPASPCPYPPDRIRSCGTLSRPSHCPPRTTTPPDGAFARPRNHPTPVAAAAGDPCMKWPVHA